MGALVATAEATTGVPAVDATVAWALAVAAVVALLAMVWRGMRALVRIAKRFDRMYEEYAGTPERDGVPAKPGMGVRVSLLERRVGGVERLLGRFLAGREEPPEDGALAAHG